MNADPTQTIICLCCRGTGLQQESADPADPYTLVCSCCEGYGCINIDGSLLNSTSVAPAKTTDGENKVSAPEVTTSHLYVADDGQSFTVLRQADDDPPWPLFVAIDPANDPVHTMTFHLTEES